MLFIQRSLWQITNGVDCFAKNRSVLFSSRSCREGIFNSLHLLWTDCFLKCVGIWLMITATSFLYRWWFRVFCVSIISLTLSLRLSCPLCQRRSFDPFHHQSIVEWGHQEFTDIRFDQPVEGFKLFLSINKRRRSIDPNDDCVFVFDCVLIEGGKWVCSSFVIEGSFNIITLPSWSDLLYYWCHPFDWQIKDAQVQALCHLWYCQSKSFNGFKSL